MQFDRSYAVTLIYTEWAKYYGHSSLKFQHVCCSVCANEINWIGLSLVRRISELCTLLNHGDKCEI